MIKLSQLLRTGLVALMLAMAPLGVIHAQDVNPPAVTETVPGDADTGSHAVTPPADQDQAMTPAEDHLSNFKTKWGELVTWASESWNKLGKLTKGLLVAIGIWPVLMLLWVPLWTLISVMFSYLGVAYLVKVVANSSIYGALRGWFEAWASKRSDRHSRELPQRDLKFPPTVKNFGTMRLEESERSTAFVALLADLNPEKQPELAQLFAKFATVLADRSSLLASINGAFDSYETEQLNAEEAYNGLRDRKGFVGRFVLTYRFKRQQKKREKLFSKAQKPDIERYHELEAQLVVLHDKLHARVQSLRTASAAKCFLDKMPKPAPAEAVPAAPAAPVTERTPD
ncbi:MAG: hypothetical protein GC134_07765 [Proteobacteria bacterium]|nr:hypothetical protein [Pseudomonadota bacterium]